MSSEVVVVARSESTGRVLLRRRGTWLGLPRIERDELIRWMQALASPSGAQPRSMGSANDPRHVLLPETREVLAMDFFDEPDPTGRSSPDLEWVDPTQALAGFSARRLALESLARAILGGGEVPPEAPVVLEEVRGIRQMPLISPTLPPALHTNCYLVGHERLLIVDPAAYEDEERSSLARQLENEIARGVKLEAVFLTHHHGDHVGAATWLRERFDVPIWAHAITAEKLAGWVVVDRHLAEQALDLGPDLNGDRFVVELLFTPGHAPGHLVLLDRRPGPKVLIAGDMVAATGTIIIDPPEGDMARYIAELLRLKDLAPDILFPAHGPLIPDGVQKLDSYVRHRLMREAKVMFALKTVGGGRPEDLLPVAYDDTSPALYPLAARSCLAHLEKLVADGAARRQEDGIFSSV